MKAFRERIRSVLEAWLVRLRGLARAVPVVLHEDSARYILMPAILLLLCGGIAGAGYRYHQAQSASIASEIRSQLSAIADLKVQEIAGWRAERIADAQVLAASPLLGAPRSAQSERRLQAWLEVYRKHGGYREVAVLDRTGRVWAAASDGASPFVSSRQALAEEALRTGEPVVSELYEAPGGSVYLDFLAAVPAPDGRPTGDVVLVRADASVSLYPMVQAWPTPSRTAESLLVRLEGDKIRYLNELRHRKGTALRLVLPLRGDLPAAQAARGIGGVRDGIDYRDIPVLAALRQIPGTHWALVAKVDAAEIYAPMRQRSHAIGWTVGLLLAGCLATFGFFLEQQQSRFYRRQHHAELERRNLAELYSYLSRHGNDVVLLLDERGGIVEANDRAVATYGYSLNELLHLSIRDLLDPAVRASFAKRWENPERQASEVFEGSQRRKDGSLLAIEVSSRRFAAGGLEFRHVIIRDITARKQSEERLRRVTRAMRVLSASNQALVRAGDEADLYGDICAAITDTGGYPLAWIGFAENDSRKSVRTMAFSGSSTEYLRRLEVTWADEPRGRGPVGRCIRSGQIAISNDVERDAGFDPWREDAERHGLKSLIALPLLCEGSVIGALTIYAGEPDAFCPDELRLLEELSGDLSYGIEVRRRELLRAQAERALRQSEMEFRALFDSANDVILICDLEGRILEVNSVASRRLGYSREELRSMTNRGIDSPAFAEQVPARMAMVVERGEALFESAHLRKDGLEIPVEISCRLFEYRGAPALLAMARDITERKRAEVEAQARATELERAKTEAENANRAKSEFLANMSHEIRTPMNGIIGMTAILADTTLTPAQRDYAETVRRSADALLAIVNNVLDFSKIEAGRMELESAVFDIVACLAETGELMAVQARARGLQYAFHAETEHDWVSGDAGRIRQIVVNLLSNAIKFTEQGQVTLRIASTQTSEDSRIRGAVFAVSVTDTGIGIAAHDLPQIFRRFTQLDSSLGKRHEGTGLGLAISIQLAELMSGTLTATSDLGRGASFCLTLPLDLAAPPRRPVCGPDQPAASLETGGSFRRRILLAEDHPVNQKIGVLVFEKLGCSVDLAANGREAAEMAERCSYDIIFMDCGMPEMDGYAATQRIREQQNGGGRVPIVALTAHAIEGVRERCLEAGMDDYIAKPASPASLERMLVKWSP